MLWLVKEKKDYSHMVWKNGKGKTEQIHIEPEGLSIQDPFKWRISAAFVTIAGPFSQFEGYNRTIVLLKGNKLNLFHRQQPNSSIILNHFEPYSFNGSWDTDSQFIIPPPPPCLLQQSHSSSSSLLSGLSISTSSAGSLGTSIGSSNSSIDINSPVLSPNLPHISLSMSKSQGQVYNSIPEVQETFDLGIISNEKEFDHCVKVYAFTCDSREISISLTQDEIPDGSALVIYPFNATIKVEHKGTEGSYQKSKLNSEHTLIIKDITYKSTSNRTIQIKSIDNEIQTNSHVVVAQISPKYQLNN